MVVCYLGLFLGVSSCISKYQKEYIATLDKCDENVCFILCSTQMLGKIMLVFIITKEHYIGK